jgi:hypothetical protein
VCSACTRDGRHRWLKAMEAGVNGIGEQAIGSPLHSHLLNVQKIVTFSSGKVFPLVARSLLNNFYFALQAVNSYFPAPSRRETYMLFFSEKSLLGFYGVFFYRFSTKRLQSIIFFSWYARVIWRGRRALLA